MEISYKYLKHITAAVICILFLLMMPESGMAKTEVFCPGEKMTFVVRWSFITAARVTIETLPIENTDGVPVYHFLYTARTSRFVDVFYKVRDRIESFTDIDMTHSLLYKKNHNGKSVNEVTTEFDWDKKEAKYVNMGNAEDPIRIEDNTFDPLSVFYAFRIGQPDKNNEIQVMVTDGKKVIHAAGKILKKQKIKVAGKSYNTLLVQPEIEGVSGVFKKTSDSKLRIWVTDDIKRIPVRIKSKVTVGSFIADLVSYTPGNDDVAASEHEE